MAQRGRKPKPTILKLAHGNPGQHALSRDEPVPPQSVPAKPDYLDAHASKVWDRVLKDLQAMRILSGADVETIAAFCVAASDLRRGVKALQEEGDFLTTDKGYAMRHPASALVSDASRRIDRHGESLGLNPSARSRIVAPGGKDSLEEFKKFLSNKGKAAGNG